MVGFPLVLTWLVAGALAAPGADVAVCDLSAPADAPFAVAGPTSATSVRVLVEVRLDGADPAWARAIGDALVQRGVRGVFVAPSGWDPAALAALAGAGHEIAADLSAGVPDSGAPDADAKALKKAAKGYGPGRPRVVLAPLARRSTEALLDLAGYRVILAEGGPATSAVRRGLVYQGQMVPEIVVAGGAYHGACGDSPVVGPFTPKAADRATLALRTAASDGGVTAVRVALDGKKASADDAAVLGRWLDTVVAPSGAVVTSALALRDEALAAKAPVEVAVAGRFVAVDDLRAAADALLAADLRTVPRSLPGDLTPTEAWLGFATLLAGRADGDVVRLGALAGPANDARSTLDGSLTVSRADVEAAAKAALVALPDRVPAAMPVGDHTLTAGETLLLFASAVRGDDPPCTHAVGVPEPNDVGLGWGAAAP